jgi:hypothetical protein
MKRTLVLAALFFAVTASGQERTGWRTAADVREGQGGWIIGTVVDVEEARNRFQLQPDGDQYQRLTVVGDAVSTQYYGFGGMINGQPEIFRGTSGFSNVRTGDRLEVRGTGQAGYTLAAEQVRLLGRAVEAGPVGVGTTREGTSVSTPTNTIPTTRQTTAASYAEGTIRQINVDEGRLVIQTPQRRMITVNGNRSTPVYYRGEVYRINNLEVGDTVRIDPDPRSAAADEITARSIEVVQSVQESMSDLPADQRLTAVIGRVTRIDRTANMLFVDDGRNETRVDMARAADGAGRRVRAADLRIGDEVDITGSYSANSNIFLASTVRFASDGVEVEEPEVVTEEEPRPEREIGDYVVVSFSGTVMEGLQTSPTLVVRERVSGRTVEVFVTDDFVIRAKNGSYAAASTLKAGDSVLVKAYRDQDENLVAQTIRIR